MTGESVPQPVVRLESNRDAETCTTFTIEFDSSLDVDGVGASMANTCTQTVMPRAASRIELEIMDIRVEQLRTITRGDAMAEGCPFANMQASDPVGWYADLWESINGKKHLWSDNPWVWVVEFKVVK